MRGSFKRMVPLYEIILAKATCLLPGGTKPDLPHSLLRWSAMRVARNLRGLAKGPDVMVQDVRLQGVSLSGGESGSPQCITAPPPVLLKVVCFGPKIGNIRARVSDLVGGTGLNGPFGSKVRMRRKTNPSHRNARHSEAPTVSRTTFTSGRSTFRPCRTE